MRVALGCLVLAAVSLLVYREPTYDPTAWLIWGRQIAHGTLDTVNGPSWKPLPVLFTTPLSLLGDTLAPALLLVLARIGGLISILTAYRVASRLAGRRAAGVIAAVALLLASEYLLNWIRGTSEGWLVALSLLAVDRHLDGRREAAFGWGVGAALLRPDVWPLLAVYGLWRLREAPDRRTAALVLGSGAAVALLWFVPEYAGSGDLLRGASRARFSVEGTPGSTAHPFLATFTTGAQALSYGVYAGAVLSLLAARRRPAVAAVAVGSVILMGIVALLASGGFTGSLRYVTLPAALLCVLSGVGWTWLAERLRGRARAALAVVAVAAAAPGLVASVDRLGSNLGRIRDLDRVYAALPGFVERVGGRAAVLRCGPVYSGAFNTQAVAYELHLRQREVSVDPRPPGTVLDTTNPTGGEVPGFALRARGTEWTMQSSC